MGQEKQPFQKYENLIDIDELLTEKQQGFELCIKAMKDNGGKNIKIKNMNLLMIKLLK